MSPSQVVIVTGASTGIGAALARELALRGHRVVATVRQPSDEVEALVSQSSGNITLCQCDVTDPVSISSAVRDTLEAWQRIDVLVNNAGYTLYGPVLEHSDAEVMQQLDTNVCGPIRMAREVIPAMRKQGGGKIINISSVAARVTSPFFGVYCSSKAALETVSEALRYELARWNIQVTVVQPGIVRTDNQFRSLAVTNTLVRGTSEYQASGDGLLEEIRKVALSRPGPRLNAVAVADLIEISQPLPFRVPVGEDTLRAITARNAATDEAWEQGLWASDAEGFPGGFFKMEREQMAGPGTISPVS